MSDLERSAWQAFRMIVEGFLGNHRRDDYAMVVLNSIESYEKLGCRMSLKLHFLHSHLDFFRDNLGNVSKEHGEGFHQDIHPSDGKALSRKVEQSHDGRLCMKFDAEMYLYIQAKKLFERPVLIKMFYGLFLISLTVLF